MWTALLTIAVGVGASYLIDHFFFNGAGTAAAAQIAETTLAPFIDYVYSGVTALSDKMVLLLKDVVPDSWLPSFTSIEPFVGLANYFLDIKFFLGLVTIRFGLVGAVGALRLARKLMPFM